MARLGRNGFLAIAVVFHLVYLWSIFDIYFVSPIVSGMRSFSPVAGDAPAKRLVLFVGDGLRADKAFQYFPDPSINADNSSESQTPRPLAPFLRSKVLSHGTFGVSHTRVPTESRPGHVALIAGLYEDVSAVTTGWKLNPVNFDSVFNRSRHTWSWGSPDILPMFKEGAVPGRIYADTYGAEFEDFTQDATQLDTWVFDRVKTLFSDASRNYALDKELRQEKNVFFLHLLGLDTTGHAYRPYSKEYLRNIQVVDKGVQEITSLIDRFYGDEQTAYIFTADHGMSDWGSHGDGHPDNTRTPLIAWGAGVAKPVVTSHGRTAPGHEDGFSSDWNLDHVTRHDVAQADVAALMSYLVGIDYPVNSVGELPLPFIAADAEAKATALLANAQGILEMYRVKEEQKRATRVKFQPFPDLNEESSSVSARVASIRQLIANDQSHDAIREAYALMQVGLRGLRYLQTYDWLFLRTIITLGYLGWISFALVTVIDMHVLHGSTKESRTVASVGAFGAIGVALFSFLYIQSSPLTYYGYAIFPVVFWEEVFARRDALVRSRPFLFGKTNGAKQYISLLLTAVAYIGLLEALVQSYFDRMIYTYCYLAAAAWPFFYGLTFVKQNKLLTLSWVVSCTTLSSFTLLPAIKTESLALILGGGFLMFSTGLIYLMFEKNIVAPTVGLKKKITRASQDDSFSRGILGAQVGLIGLAMTVTRSGVLSIQAKKGLPLGTQIVGWTVLVASLTVPFLHGLRPNNHYLHRLMVIFLAFSPIFIILTISYEGLFYFCFFALLATWVRLEHEVYQHQLQHDQAPGLIQESVAIAEEDDGDETTVKQSQYRALTLADARISLFFFFLLQSAFFSTGNIASVSSFSLDAVYRLIPVFDPFSQGALLLLKLMIPFAIISANLGILNRRLGVTPSALFMLVMAISDVMTLNFFYMVRDEGSWLDIGTTISHFCIASLLCVFVAGLEFVSELFVSGVEFESSQQRVSLNGLVKKSKRKAAMAMNGNGKTH